MAMPHPETEWTLDMVHALPDDGNRYELLDGELLVSPTPSLLHQRVPHRALQAGAIHTSSRWEGMRRCSPRSPCSKSTRGSR